MSTHCILYIILYIISIILMGGMAWFTMIIISNKIDEIKDKRKKKGKNHDNQA